MPAPPVPITSGGSWLSRAVIVDHDTGDEHEVGVVDATVTVDRKSDARRVVDATLSPDADPRLVAPPHRLKLWTGYRLGGVEHWAPLAHVRIGRVSRGHYGEFEVRQCRSFEALVAAARFTYPRTIQGYASMMDALQLLILEAVPWADVRVETTRDALVPPGGVTEEIDRWAMVAGREKSIATALGVDVGCDPLGSFVIRELPGGDPVWTVAEGPGGLLVDYSEERSADDVVNVWTACSDHPDVAPVRATVEDRQAASPTHVDRWGVSSQTYKSPLLTTQPQCAAAAETRLANTRGWTVGLDFSSVPNPWADIAEPVAATRNGTTEVHVLDKLTHSCSPDRPLTVSAAARTVAINA